MNRTWIILDAPFVAWRAHCLFDGMTYDGVENDVIYGFIKEIFILQSRFNTTHLAFCFDDCNDECPNVRSLVYPAYKQKRHKEVSPEEMVKKKSVWRQMALLKDNLLTEIGWKNILSQPGYEADDCIASVCQNLPASDSAVIVSSDKDLYQLLNARVSICNPIKRAVYTEESFKALYKITPAQWTEVQSIAGCNTDNVEGIPGIGPAFACNHIRGLLKPRYKSYINIEKGKDIIARNRPLVTLPYAGMPRLHLRDDGFSWPKLWGVLKRYGISGIKNVVPQEASNV